MLVRSHAMLMFSLASLWTHPAAAGVPQSHKVARRLEEDTCRAVALRFLPPPSFVAYQRCFQEKLQSNNSHDWSVPGAEIAAYADCWCEHNMTATFNDYGCCNHRDVYPMCTTDCSANCSSDLAQECIQTCPSMCFEAAEYIVDRALCNGCDWIKCWPVVRCLTDHAEQRVESGDVQRTCDEVAFRDAQEIPDYWSCWRDIPKHSSHWNILSSVLHCVCREGMIGLLNNTHCCDSLLYGGGACSLECRSEKDCNSQEAQTCIHTCQLKCPASQITPSNDCVEHCLEKTSPCAQFASCRPPSVTGYICADGRWPEASSGCCEQEPGSNLMGCPKLCESQQLWRLDRRNGLPWWTRWDNGQGMVTQCSCSDCPLTLGEGHMKLVTTLKDNLWDNGQVFLVDVARRSGLTLGPNRRMQELMKERNDKISAILDEETDVEGSEDVEVNRRIEAVHVEYTVKITNAAVEYPDDGARDQPSIIIEKKMVDNKKESRNNALIATIVICTIVVLLALCIATIFVLRRKNKTPVHEFGTGTVVFGSPVAAGADVPHAAIQVGAPVTVSAPVKAMRSNEKGAE